MNATVCTCPEYDHEADKPVGPHQHLVVSITDLQVGDRLTLCTVTSPGRMVDPYEIAYPVRYEGGLVTDYRANTGSRVAICRPLPDYLWPDPNSDGWVDAWNGWYPNIAMALEESAGGAGRPWILRSGDGLVSLEDEGERPVTP